MTALMQERETTRERERERERERCSVCRRELWDVVYVHETERVRVSEREGGREIWTK